MIKFDFEAIDDQGRRVRDSIEAPTDVRAQQLLRERGLTVLSLSVSAPANEPGRESLAPAPMHSERQTAAPPSDPQMRVVAEVARASFNEVPLQPVLRALAAEMPRGRTRSRLLRACRRLDGGEPLGAAIESMGRGGHAYLPALMEAGVGTGQLPFVLSQLLRLSAQDRQLTSGLWFSLGYGLILILVSFGVSLFLLGWFVPLFRPLFDDFGLELPYITLAVLEISYAVQNFGAPLLLTLSALAVGGWLLYALMRRTVPGMEAVGVMCRRAVYLLPLFGSVVRYSAMSRFCALLSMLMTTKIPFPQALRLAGAGSSDVNLATSCRKLAGACEGGESLLSATQRLTYFPRELVHLFRWERQGDAFRTALDASSELFAARAMVQVGIASIFIEPLLLIVAGGTVGLVVVSVFSPLIKLLNDLS